MNTPTYSRKKSLKRQVIFGCVLIAIIAAGLLLIYILTTNAQQAAEQNAAASKQKLVSLDTTLRETIERKKQEKIAAAAATAQLVTTIDASQAAKVDAKTCLSTDSHSSADNVDVIVNKKQCMQPLNYTPSDLTEIYGATLSTKAAAAFKGMYEAAQAAGQGFTVTSSYRSFADQVSTYQYWVATSGIAGADTYSARPGYSEHQTGFVIDVAANGCVLDCFGSTSQYQWMQQHAAEYGFIQRYYAGSEDITGYKAEEWHYRYVGEEVALDMKAKGIMTLEAYWNVPGGTY